MTHHITNEPPREFIRSPEPEWTAHPNTMERHIYVARREMGPERARQLDAEWNEQ